LSVCLSPCLSICPYTCQSIYLSQTYACPTQTTKSSSCTLPLSSLPYPMTNTQTCQPQTQRKHR
jgi:hypothetical protein